MNHRHQRIRSVGNIIAPPRFLLFLAVTAIAAWFAIPAFGLRIGIMAAFDAGAIIFLLALSPLLHHRASNMRESACRNDGNRAMLLLITVMVGIAVFASIASELMSNAKNHPWAPPVIVATLILSWVFSNVIYALHYAHLFYIEKRGGGDTGGLQFPDTREPDYWDFLYFAICLGMTFQTSDVTINERRMRRVVTGHCLAAFVFNLGILAFTINVLGG
ncbi:DUF1345 domain-containing protein [Sphingomonas sp. KR3-1]|uniref:DUF1345 domain-containing protein n=1 Tax=Sphingomonas sp. KR3-1 TaxID=3156611 RepID=UPI0032B47D02